MTVASDLYHLQEIDLDIDTKEAAVRQTTARLGENETVLSARSRLAAEQAHLEELTKQQRALEWEIDDLSTKIKANDKDLYGGRIRNPKELSDLQAQTNVLKERCGQLEDRALAVMEEAETSRQTLARLTGELSSAERQWEADHQRLTAELAQLNEALTDLHAQRDQVRGGIDAQTLELYALIRRRRGTAVARVEQGICRGCRISLPVSELQQARAGRLVQCGSCSRVLYLP